MKQDLTPDGVAAKLAEIYAMTRANRLAEASDVEANFNGWVTVNFNLTTEQATFLSGIAVPAADLYGSNCGTCFRQQLQIALAAPRPPKPLDHATKWLKMTNNILTSTNASGELEYSGSLLFEYEYRENN